MKFEEKTKNNFLKKEICGSMIYFLIKNNEVVYVGQSKNGISRIFFHKYTKKDFDNLYFINCKEKELSTLENYYITKYKPLYNKTLNKANEDLITYTQFYYYEYKFDKAPRLNFKEAKKIIIENKLYNTQFKKCLYLNKNDLIKINDVLTNISLKKGGNNK